VLKLRDASSVAIIESCPTSEGTLCALFMGGGGDNLQRRSLIATAGVHIPTAKTDTGLLPFPGWGRLNHRRVSNLIPTQGIKFTATVSAEEMGVDGTLLDNVYQLAEATSEALVQSALSGELQSEIRAVASMFQANALLYITITDVLPLSMTSVRYVSTAPPTPSPTYVSVDMGVPDMEYIEPMEQPVAVTNRITSLWMIACLMFVLVIGWLVMHTCPCKKGWKSSRKNGGSDHSSGKTTLGVRKLQRRLKSDNIGDRLLSVVGGKLVGVELVDGVVRLKEDMCDFETYVPVSVTSIDRRATESPFHWSEDGSTACDATVTSSSELLPQTNKSDKKGKVR